VPLPDEFTSLAREVNNWGRWGEDDELGTLNLITDEAVRRAAASVKSGKRFPLALSLSQDGPQTGALPGRVNPLHVMTQINTSYSPDPDGVRASDDAVVMGLQCATHWDALAHVSYAGRIYNGFPADSITEHGASRCGIDKTPAIVSRGVLLDVARAKGVDSLDGGYAITSDDLDLAADHASVKIEPGDIMLIRTGHMRLLEAGDRQAFMYPSPGPGMDAVRWFRRMDIAAVATDNLAFEVLPGERADLFLPVHLLDLVEIGLIQGQNFCLEALANDCADDGEYTFLLEASPEPFANAVGSPVQPVAAK
jgi:kynurenine formamidase